MRKKKEWTWKLSLLVFLLLLAGCEQKKEEFVLEEVEVEQQEELEETDSETNNSQIYIYVCGSVYNPGVYELEEGARVFEAIQMAGGMKTGAAETFVNQAEVLQDGQKIYIPSLEEILEEENVEEEASDGKVNINRAGKEELMTLNGIGDKRAEAILAYREVHGSFESIEELMQVEGIKQGTYDKIKDQIKVT